MKNRIASICIFIGVIIASIWTIATWNNLSNLRENVDMQWAQVENLMEDRSELIPNFVEVVMGHAQYEEKIIADITEAQNNFIMSINGGNPDDITNADNRLNTAYNSLLSYSAKFSELQTSKHYTALEDELSGYQHMISLAKEKYNEKVGEYNNAIQTWPKSMIASLFGFDKIDYHKVDEKSLVVPIIDMNYNN